MESPWSTFEGLPTLNLEAPGKATPQTDADAARFGRNYEKLCQVITADGELRTLNAANQGNEAKLWDAMHVAASSVSVKM